MEEKNEFSKSIKVESSINFSEIIGRKCQKLDTIKHNSKIDGFNVNAQERTIEFYGTRDSVESALKLVNIQIHYETDGGRKNILYKYLDFPELYEQHNIVYHDEQVTVVYDGMPRGSIHFLILPKDKRVTKASILRKKHITLLKHMEEVGQMIIAKKDFSKAVFMPISIHAVPSLYPLHAHVISDDFQGSGCRKPKHYNAFTTPCSIPLSTVIERLASGEPVLGKYSRKDYETFKCQPMTCHKCSKTFGTKMKTLQNHLTLCSGNIAEEMQEH